MPLPSWEEVQTVIEGNLFIAAVLFAPVLLGMFYFIGVGFGKVEKAHDAWVERENRTAEWEGESRKRQ